MLIAFVADVLVVGHSDVPELSEEVAKKLFLKKIEVLPNGTSVVPFDLSDNNYVKWDFYEKLAGKKPDQVHSYWSRALLTTAQTPPEQIKSAAELQEKISKTPGAIGYIDEKDVAPGMKVLLRISG